MSKSAIINTKVQKNNTSRLKIINKILQKKVMEAK